MNTCEYLARNLHYTRQATLKMVKGLSSADLYFRATPTANSIGFLLWHVSRWEDRWINQRIQKLSEVWVSEGWYRKLCLPEDAVGSGYTSKQVEKVIIPDLNMLLAYMDAVHAKAQAYVRALDPAGLDKTVFEMPGRPGTPFQILRQLAHHESQHNGQIEFIIGNYLRKDH